jgi:anti-sigma factor RsiW
MKAMQCDRAGELIGAYLDQELDAETRREVAAHLDGCAACSAMADDFRRMSGKLAMLGRAPAPEHLDERVRSLVKEADGGAIASPRPVAQGDRLRQGWLRQAAVLLLACGVTAAATALLTSRMDGMAALERDVAAAHVRSLLQDSPMQVASSDTHTIKPWFSGRLEFAPVVKDLSAEGFPLAGARLDVIGDRRVAALVYRRRLHIVNVFLWPAADGSPNSPREFSRRGYNVVTWAKDGMTYWAISDLNMAELRHLQALL